MISSDDILKVFLEASFTLKVSLTNFVAKMKLIKQIKASNQRKQIKLRVRPTDSKGYSLFLDVWNEGKRQYEFLKMYFYGKTSTINQDQETIRLASAIRDRKEIELLQRRTGFELTVISCASELVHPLASVTVTVNVTPVPTVMDCAEEPLLHK